MPRYTAVDETAIRAQVEILQSRMARADRMITRATAQEDDDGVELALTAYLAAHNEMVVLRKAQRRIGR